MSLTAEIERLRAELEHLQLDYKVMSDTNDLIDAENGRLRAARCDFDCSYCAEVGKKET